jgi:hypothetical protein
MSEPHTHTHTPIVDFGPDIPIFTKIYDLYKVLSDFLVLYPKIKRYTLGQKIDTVTLEILELVIIAGYSHQNQKLPILQKISFKLDFLKVLLRLSWESKCLDHKKYQLLTGLVIEAGKMLGGWIKILQ